MSQADFLARIIAQKWTEVAATKSQALAGDWRRRIRDLPPPPDFRAALADRSRMRVIAEIKKASPSAGVIRSDFNPSAIAAGYYKAGADCVSVLTDRKFFQGDIEHLRAVATAIPRPVLRKDFVVDAVQVLEARLAGAAAVLLIAECLTKQQLGDLVQTIREFGMQPLVELHDSENLQAVLDSGTDLIGINNRDLRTFLTDVGKTLALLPSIPADKIVVGESGIADAATALSLHQAGVHAILVGESFMRARDPGELLAQWLADLQ